TGCSWKRIRSSEWLSASTTSCRAISKLSRPEAAFSETTNCSFASQAKAGRLIHESCSHPRLWRLGQDSPRGSRHAKSKEGRGPHPCSRRGHQSRGLDDSREDLQP